MEWAKDLEIIRVKDFVGGRVRTSLHIKDMYSSAEIIDILSKIANFYEIPIETLKERAEETIIEFGKKNIDNFNENRYETMSIYKYIDATDARKAKKELKRWVREVENFLKTLDKIAREIKAEYDLDKWIYDKMVFDPEKQKFVKSS